MPALPLPFRKRRLALTLSLLVSPTLAVSAAPAMPADAGPLFDTARIWSSKHRDDLALEAISKALVVAPANPVLLAEDIHIELRLGHVGAAQRALARLRAAAALAPEARQADDEIRVATRDRQEMATIRLLARTGHNDEAARRLAALFPQGPPGGTLGVEYQRILGHTPAGRAAAIGALRATLADDPRNADAQLALADLLNEEDTRAEALRLARELALRDDYDHAVAMDMWRRVLKAAGDDPAYRDALRDYVQRFPTDTQLAERLVTMQARADARLAQANDPDFLAQQRGLRALAANRLDDAEPLLTRAARVRSTDPDALGGLGLLRLRQGRHDDAYALFKRAAALAPDNRAKWRSLARTARFYGLLASARETLASDPSQAETALRQALRIQPGNPDAQALLADALLAEHKDAQAGTLLEALLAAPAPSVSLARDLVTVYQRTGRADQVDALLDGLQDRFTAAPEREALAGMRADALDTEAERLLARGRSEAATERYEAQLRLRPDTPWVRYTLAKLYRDAGMAPRGLAVMADGLQVSDSPAMRYATALFRNSLDDVGGAQAALAPVPEAERTDGMRALARRLEVRQMLAAAHGAFAHGDAPGAGRLLDQASARAGDDGQMVASIGAAWIDGADPARGVALLREWMAAHPAQVDADLRLRYGDLLGSARRNQELAAWLAELRREPGLDAHQRARLEDQDLRLALRETDALIEQQDYAAARERLAHVSVAGRADKRYALERADIERADGDFPAARAALRPVLARTPDDPEAQLALARVLEQSGKRKRALAIVRRVLARHPEDLDVRLSAVRRLTSLHQFDEAGAASAALRTDYPQQPEVTVQAGRLAQSEGLYEDAAALYRQSLQQEQAAGVMPGLEPTPAQKAFDSLAERRNPEVETGYLSAYKSGDPGVSDYHAQQVPIYVQIPYRYDGHLFAHVDAVHLDAGTLSNPDLGAYTRNTFGTFAARNEAAPLAASVVQHATGVALGLGYESDAWRADLGTTPLGFPVQSVVGGVRYRVATDDASFTLSASRRPETSSELSYAGARDPVTGAVWGGVRRDGIDLHTSIDIGKINFFASLGGGVLTGRNVKTNEEVVLRTGVEVPVYTRADTRVSTGLVGNAWHYTDNLRFYTFGQGGYYSPQRYLSLGVPLEWAGRRDALTWDVKATLGYSWTYERDSPYFPIGLPASANLSPSSSPVFSGGPGGGFSYAAGGTIQYRINAQVAIGVRIDIEHSHDYAPSAAMIFVRYAFDARKEEDSLFPHPVRLYSSY